MNHNDERNFVLRPTPEQKFRQAVVLPIIKETVHENLADQTFNSDTVEELSKTVAVSIRTKLVNLQYPRYKFVVQVYLSEQAGQGITTATQSIWDGDCDGYVHYRYTNNSIWCQAIVFAVFSY
ncbi:unnamed protein product [Caenorhabditis bovis]|uniref:Uncharacterized protein n=1 Tax=Caenorhabditis bovis TaxID=2654633 RepID=A0A8S1EI98_9PELO|nr:unnamed protein product [Caenorhabditis bovis]